MHRVRSQDVNQLTPRRWLRHMGCYLSLGCLSQPVNQTWLSRRARRGGGHPPAAASALRLEALVLHACPACWISLDLPTVSPIPNCAHPKLPQYTPWCEVSDVDDTLDSLQTSNPLDRGNIGEPVIGSPPGPCFLDLSGLLGLLWVRGVGLPGHLVPWLSTFDSDLK